MQQRKQERQEKKQEKNAQKNRNSIRSTRQGIKLTYSYGGRRISSSSFSFSSPRKGRTICDADDGVTGQRKRTAAAAAGSRVWGEGSGDERSITAAEYAPPSPRGYEVEGGLRLWEDRTRTRTLTWSSGLSVTQDSGSTRRENKHSVAKYHKFSI